VEKWKSGKVEKWKSKLKVFKWVLAGALILVAAGTASGQQGRAAGDKDSMLAFVSERDGNSEIDVMNADGSNLVRRTQTGRNDAPAWSPDGSTIAFSSRACRDCPGSLRYVSTDGTRSGLIFSNGHSPAWRP